MLDPIGAEWLHGSGRAYPARRERRWVLVYAIDFEYKKDWYVWKVRISDATWLRVRISMDQLVSRKYLEAVDTVDTGVLEEKVGQIHWVKRSEGMWCPH